MLAERVSIFQPPQKFRVDLIRGGKLEFVMEAVFGDLFRFGDARAIDGVIGADVEVEIALAGMRTGEANAAR
jgi:hypothetical protein